jgi:hypothetical protein
MPERDSRGHFLPGNGGGPGRPRRSVEASYVRAITSAVPPRTVTAILRKLVARALDGDGDVKAALAVVKCVLGNDPPAVVELAEKLKELEADIEADRQEQQQAQRQQQARRQTSKPWSPRSLAGEAGNGNGTDDRGTGDTGDPDGGSGLPPLFS